MKTLTEFNAIHIKNAAKTRTELTAAGKTAEELPAAMSEALKLEGDKITMMVNALETVGTKVNDLKRVIVFTITEGEKISLHGAVQKGEHYYAVEYYPPIAGKGGDRGGRPGRDSRDAGGRGGDRGKGKRGAGGGKPGGRGGERTGGFGGGSDRGERGPRRERAPLEARPTGAEGVVIFTKPRVGADGANPRPAREPRAPREARPPRTKTPPEGNRNFPKIDPITKTLIKSENPAPLAAAASEKTGDDQSAST